MKNKAEITGIVQRAVHAGYVCPNTAEMTWIWSADLLSLLADFLSKSPCVLVIHTMPHMLHVPCDFCWPIRLAFLRHNHCSVLAPCEFPPSPDSLLLSLWLSHYIQDVQVLTYRWRVQEIQYCHPTAVVVSVGHLPDDLTYLLLNMKVPPAPNISVWKVIM